MADIQIAVIDEKDTQIALAVPGVQGPAGAISSGGSANQVFYKVSGTNYDAGWTFIGNANVDASAAIAGTKISPNFGSQAIVTTGTNTAASFIPTSSSIPSNGIYLPGANQVAVATNGNARLYIASDGKVGIGTTSPNSTLHVVGNQFLTGGNYFTDATSGYFFNGSGGFAGGIFGSNSGNIANIVSPQTITLSTASSERARIDSSGRLLVGTSTSRSTYNAGDAPKFQVESVTAGATAGIAFSSDNQNSSELYLAKARGSAVNSHTIVQNNDNLGILFFGGADGTNIIRAASVGAQVDGTPGANDMPGRLVFSTTADGASTPTERMRITSGGFFKAKADTTYQGSTFDFHEFNSATNAVTLNIVNKHASYTSPLLNGGSDRAASSSYDFENWYSSYSGSFDLEFRLRGDGNGLCDGAWTGGGADYAEYFEWLDGNNKEEDRRGISVVLDGDKIRETVAGEDPIGVISGNPSVVGDSAWNKWSGKYLRDEFGTYIQEDYEVTDEDGNTVTQQRRKLNPAYDPEAEYIPREQRPEWDCVGLMGKLRIRKGQVTGSRWIKMRDISDSVEEWLVR